jgi:ribosomal-protein-alanine N-acetyltransferase
MIETDRLQLVPATLSALRAELESPAALAAVARMEVPGAWPPELYDRDPLMFTIGRLEAAPEEASWWLYYFILKDPDGGQGTAIGCGGYKGPPKEDGTVEVGYSVLPQYRRQGFASEAVEGFVRAAFADARIERVIAETLPELEPSIAVLKKCGFRFLGVGSEEGVIRYELLRSSWATPPRSPDQPRGIQ